MQSLSFCSILALLFTLISFPLAAQKWSGQVFKQHHSGAITPLSATILNKTQNKQTFSRDDGRFTLVASTGDSISIYNYAPETLEIPDFNYFIGFGSGNELRDTTFLWAGQDTILIPIPIPTLYYDGYFSRPITDKQQLVKAKYFNPGNRYDPYQLIQGKIPGVVISRPGGDPNYAYQVQIRGLHTAIYKGFSSFPTSNGYNQQFDLTQPLVVVDGMPGVALNTIDPQDIASIEVIRDVASLAVYGMRGANGVIQIQTKRGKLRSSGLEYSTYLAIDRAIKPDLGISAATYRKLIGPDGPYQGFNRDLGANTDWYGAISRTGFSQAHNLALNGTALDAAYRLAVNLRQVNGVAKKSGFDQVNALFNFQKEIAKGKGKLDGLFSITNRSTSEVNPDIFRNAALMNPTAPVRSDTATRSGGYYQPNVFALLNPIAQLNQHTYESTFQSITAALNGEWQVRKWLMLKANAGYQHKQDGNGWTQAPGVAFSSAGLVGDASWEERTLNHLYFNALVQGNWAWQNQKLETQLGYSLQRWNGTGFIREGNSFNNQTPAYQPLITNEWQKKAWTVDESNYQESDQMPAGFGLAQYTYKNRWFAQGTLRREGFTRLGDNKWAWYPALSIGGQLLGFKKSIDHLGFRLGYGVTGNIPPKTYATHALVLPGGPNVFINGEFKPGIYYPFIPNPNLQAEVRKELNLALDFVVFNQRLQGQVQVYSSRSTNLLWQYSTEETNGFSNLRFENKMALRNHGVEIQLNAKVIQSQNLNWQSNLSLAQNQTILDAPFPQYNAQSVANPLLVGSPGSPGYCCGGLQLLENQKPIGQFFTYRTDGISEEGQWKLRDLNGDQIIQEKDKTITGNAQPNLTLGWDNTLQWKQFSLNVFWRGAFGHDLMNLFNLFYANPQVLKNFGGYSIPAVALSGDYSKLKASFNPISDYFVQNASFLRLENLSLGYNLPFSKSQKQRSLYLYLSAQNLLTISGFSGNDPEVRLSNLGAGLVPGLVNPNYFVYQRDLSAADRGRYPLTQTLVIGAKLKW